MESIETQGIRFPRLGFGTFLMTGDACRVATESALSLGYRHIDTAEMYANEDAVGDAIANSGIKRGDLHVTTKVWYENLAPDAIQRAFDLSLKKLKLDFVDLYLIHWPSKSMDLPRALEALMRLREEGRTRAIGVANFTLPLMKTAIETVGAPIACNQVEYHTFLDQSVLLKYLRAKGVPLVAYAPLAKGTVVDSPELQTIGRKHGVSAAQVAIAWLLEQDNVAAIPKAQSPASQQANLDALAVKLDDEDRRAIAALPKGGRRVNPAFAPEWDAPAG
ncbi:aldo/keto reductase [Bradyrhizobium sp. SYSU BS000235]|uniref:aldo/keto reductase n=1 Tax=Bradyrhizobium sp. SYSU BS000235 TaxID=3411332 RepID=UPI003C76F4D1